MAVQNREATMLICCSSGKWCVPTRRNRLM
jgi:hypothetical protein